MHEKPCVCVENLTIAYRGEYVFRGDSFTAEGPGLVTVIGPNGAGKTTLFRAITGLVRPLSGRVVVNGEDVTGDPGRAGLHVGYVPQLTHVYRGFPLTGRELVELSLGLRRRPPRIVTPREVKERAERYLEMVGALGFADRPVSRLSGGQLQRILIARAVARETSVLVMDEPLSGIDPRGKEDIARLIEGLAREKLVFVSSHDPIMFLNRTRYLMVVNRGIKSFGSPRETFRLDLLRQAYGGSVYLIEKCIHVFER